jgi:hypothetical protein
MALLSSRLEAVPSTAGARGVSDIVSDIFPVGPRERRARCSTPHLRAAAPRRYASLVREMRTNHAADANDSLTGEAPREAAGRARFLLVWRRFYAGVLAVGATRRPGRATGLSPIPVNSKDRVSHMARSLLEGLMPLGGTGIGRESRQS